MNKRILVLLLAAVLLLTAGCGGSEKILSTEGVPQEVLQAPSTRRRRPRKPRLSLPTTMCR